MGFSWVPGRPTIGQREALSETRVRRSQRLLAMARLWTRGTSGRAVAVLGALHQCPESKWVFLSSFGASSQVLRPHNRQFSLVLLYKCLLRWFSIVFVPSRPGLQARFLRFGLAAGSSPLASRRSSSETEGKLQWTPGRIGGCGAPEGPQAQEVGFIELVLSEGAWTQQLQEQCVEQAQSIT